MCSIFANDKIQPSYEDNESIIVDTPMPKNATTKALKALGGTTNFIDIWVKLFVEKYDARSVAYINYIKYIFKQIHQTMSKALTPKQKVKKLMTNISGGWYMKKNAKGLPSLQRSKLSKKSKR